LESDAHGSIVSHARTPPETSMANESGDGSPRSISVFFYGLFMDADALRAKGFHPANERQACVHGMALRIGKRATLAPDTSKSVYGFIMDISHAELDRLCAEPGLEAYRPEAVIAQSTSGESIAALCYNLPAVPDPGEQNPEYAAKLLDVERRLGLPDQYMESIC
jgi:hypothetical protein